MNVVLSPGENLVRTMALTPGTGLGRYEIRSLLGQGGMGEVYLAQDNKLRRSVAVKVLPATFTASEDRLRRFEQEAYTASALNHPNIITIYEIGEADTLHYIVTEFIDGESLRERLKGKRMELPEILDVAAQVASALSTAHQAGIVHRDIKPENIMRRRDGIVKVLDFGLAKLVERPTSNPEAATVQMLEMYETESGVVVGTRSYMSPEQAKGQEVDARADVWSFGVVLYEMITEHAPFGGATPNDMLAEILRVDPPPLPHGPPRVPAELQRIVSKALRKDREERYQTAKDLLVDLKNLRRELEITAENEVQPARPASSAEYLVSEIKQHKKVAILLTALIVVASIAFGLNKLTGQNKSRPAAPAPLQTMKITHLTNSGTAVTAVISPDGNYVVYAMNAGGQQSLWTKHIATGSEVQIVAPDDVLYDGLTFSHDSSYVYYIISRSNARVRFLYQVAVLGGPPKKLLEDVDTPITLSPDASRFAFTRWDRMLGESALMIANADGTGEQKIAKRKTPDAIYWSAWSPDGKVIAFVAKGFNAGISFYNIVGVEVEGGIEKPIVSQKWLSISGVAWLSDGSGLVFAGREQVSSPAQIWHASYPGGEVSRITNDTNRYSNLSLTANSTAIATVKADPISNIWLAPNGDASRAKQVTSGESEGYLGLSWTPDGRIVYTSSADGHQNIWIMDENGINRKQLTLDTHANSSPSVSADGRYIVFVSDRTGSSNVWRMDIDGNNPRQLSFGQAEYAPQCSSDSQWVVFQSYDLGKPTLMKVSINGGDGVRLTDQPANGMPAISPDGRWIAYYYVDVSNKVKMSIIPFEGGQAIKVFDVSPTIVWGIVQWKSDELTPTYIDNKHGISNIWSQPLDGRPPKQLTDFKSDLIFFFDWSRNGKQLACVRGAVISDVVLIKDFR